MGTRKVRIPAVRQRGETDPLATVIVAVVVVFAVIAAATMLMGCTAATSGVIAKDEGSLDHSRQLRVDANHCQELQVWFESEGGVYADEGKSLDDKSVTVDPSGLIGPQAGGK